MIESWILSKLDPLRLRRSDTTVENFNGASVDCSFLAFFTILRRSVIIRPVIGDWDP